MKRELTIRMLSSLEKIFPDEPGRGPEWKSGSMLRNEWHSITLAVRYDGYNWGRTDAFVEVESSLAPWIEVRRIGLVPSALPCYDRRDAGYLRTEPGLYPDVLETLRDGRATWIVPGRWEGFWVRIRGDGTLPTGDHLVTIRISVRKTDADPAMAIDALASDACSYRLHVVDAHLPTQAISFTQWLHADGIALAHRVAILSEDFWRLLPRYLAVAVAHGATHLLTPLFTPPLDTAVGGVRPLAQLIGVWRDPDGGLSFDFSNLDRWIRTALDCGIRVIEFAHLFTQWGLASAPRIRIIENGIATDRFGWGSDAMGSEYVGFLEVFLPSLRLHLSEEGWSGACCFHVSDEPDTGDTKRYRAAFGLVTRLVEDLPILDAVSDPVYGDMGPNHTPVVALDRLGPFLPRRGKNLWTYYCCAQNQRVSNRFFAMPSSRNRILGIQLYWHDIQGFLQWGFNFYQSKHSLRAIDPYAVSDADGAFPSGDAFSVYPTVDGCVESLRLVVFHEALQDHRALKLYESQVGRPAVLAFNVSRFRAGFSFEDFPLDPAVLLEFRSDLNRAIESVERTHE
jgi:hypothetical protein